jgi:Hydrolytic ATP binding site of dynein motor region
MRPVSLVIPDMSSILEVLLVCEGFTSAHDLAAKLAYTYRRAPQVLSLKNRLLHTFTLREARVAVKSAGVTLRLSKAADATQATATEKAILTATMWSCHSMRLSEEDAQLYKLLLADVFTNGDVSTLTLSLAVTHAADTHATALKTAIEVCATVIYYLLLYTSSSDGCLRMHYYHRYRCVM